jgi:hypothetical protein
VTKLDPKKPTDIIRGARPGKADVVEIPEMNFFMIDGRGDPNGSESFRASVESLFGVSYTLRFALKKSRRADYSVGPLEGLWWADDMASFMTDVRNDWEWTLMIKQPEIVTAADAENAQWEFAKKKKLVSLPGLRFGRFHEGSAVQTLHIGPYSTEGPAIRVLHEAVADMGGRLSGKHHEIYLSDARRTPSEKLKTILRQPFSR